MSKQIEVAVIYPDGRVEKKPLGTDLDALQAAVGGDIESLKLAPGVWAWVNEDGKGLGLPTNLKATAFCRLVGPNIRDDDFIVGAMVVTGASGNRPVTEKCWALIQKLKITELK